jgi:hypothetical protein
MAKDAGDVPAWHGRERGITNAQKISFEHPQIKAGRHISQSGTAQPSPLMATY